MGEGGEGGGGVGVGVGGGGGGGWGVGGGVWAGVGGGVVWGWGVLAYAWRGGGVGGGPAACRRAARPCGGVLVRGVSLPPVGCLGRSFLQPGVGGPRPLPPPPWGRGGGAGVGGGGGGGGGSYTRASAPPFYCCASALSSNKVETDTSRALMVQSVLVALSHYSPQVGSPSWFPKIANFLQGRL